MGAMTKKKRITVYRIVLSLIYIVFESLQQTSKELTALPH